MQAPSGVKHQVLRGTAFLLLATGTHAFADPWVEEIRDNAGNVEMRVFSLDRSEKTRNRKNIPNPNGPYMVLACRNSTFSISLEWREPVGKLGERRRHLFYHVDGYSHLMLPVVSKTGQTTGYENQSAKAKALVHEILATLKLDFIPIGVFPAGRDPVTGKWIDVWFPATAFRESALSIGKACKFDPSNAQSNAHDVDKVPPARPGGQ